MITLDSVAFASGSKTNIPLTLNAALVQVPLPYPTAATVRSLAAYVRSAANGKLPIALDVGLRITGAPPATTWIGTKRRRGSIAGDVTATAVKASDWHAGRATVRVKVPTHGLSRSGVGCHELVWEWFSGTDPSLLTHSIGKSQHLVYLTLEPPLPPWTDGSAGSPAITPWVDAVHWACVLASGATTAADARGLLVTGLLGLGHVSPTGVCLKDKARPSYTPEGATPAVFFAGKFFRRLAGLGTEPFVMINCTDAATILNVLAAVLGCPLDLKIINRPTGFHINQTRLIGAKIIGDEFDYHEMNLVAGGSGASKVYDCCLQVDNDGNPAKAPSTWITVGGLPLASKKGASAGAGYLSLLIEASDRSECTVSGLTTRWIGSAPTQKTFEPVRAALYRKHVERLLSLPVAAEQAHVEIDIATAWTGFAVIGTETVSPVVPRDPDLPQHPVYQEFQLKSLAADDVELQVDVLPAATRNEAIALLAEWLVEIEIKLEEGKLGIGEYAYRLPDRTLILFLSDLWACRVESAGATDIDVSPLAVSLAAQMRPESS